MEAFARNLGVKVIHVDASADFLGALNGVNDPEAKCKIIGRLFVEVFQREYADLLRRADAIFIEELRRNDWYDRTSQAFAVFLPVRSVGVMGDGRTYERAVVTQDFMTASWAPLPHDLLATVSNRIINVLVTLVEAYENKHHDFGPKS